MWSLWLQVDERRPGIRRANAEQKWVNNDLLLKFEMFYCVRASVYCIPVLVWCYMLHFRFSLNGDGGYIHSLVCLFECCRDEIFNFRNCLLVLFYQQQNKKRSRESIKRLLSWYNTAVVFEEFFNWRKKVVKIYVK